MIKLNSNNRKHLDSNLPINLLNDTEDIEDLDSLLRYIQIINLMVTKYNYKVINYTPTFDHIQHIIEWVLIKNNETELNKDMLNDYIFKHEYCLSERLGIAYRNLDLTQLKG